MQSNKPIQKKPKDHNTSPQRTKKDKAQTQDQSRFQLVPLPQKFVNLSKIHRLYADLIIMESDDTIISDGSLYNIYKIYQRIEIENHTSQRLVRVYLQNKDNQLEDWRKIVDKIRNSVSSNVRPWAELVKTYCERYEEMIQEFQGEMPSEKKTQLSEINMHTKKIRQTLINTHPLIEFTSQLRNGHIELTEIAYSEKYLAELGYGVDEMVNAVFKGGIPIFFPLNSRSSWPARMGLEKWMTVEPDGTRTPEIEIYILTKDGTVKTAKCILHYHIIYEKGALGFLCFITVMGKPKACADSVRPMEKLIMTKDFTNMSFEKEMEHADFLEMFYGIRPEHR